MTTRRILATSGGFMLAESGRENARRPGGTFLEALRLSGKDRPRVLFVHTASGDDKNYLALSYQAVRDLSADADHLVLFPYPNQTPEEAFGRADVVWVGGGSVANLLALWRVHGVDEAARDAWERGVILGGVSAGSICWHVGGTTDSYGPDLRIVTGGLGLIPYGNGVHYDSEAQRRPLLQSLVRSTELPLSYCTDDRVGILYEGTEPVRVITDYDVDPETGPAAYKVERTADGGVVETRLAPGTIA
jgi:peptidase E